MNPLVFAFIILWVAFITAIFQRNELRDKNEYLTKELIKCGVSGEKI